MVLVVVSLLLMRQQFHAGMYSSTPQAVMIMPGKYDYRQVKRVEEQGFGSREL